LRKRSSTSRAPSASSRCDTCVTPATHAPQSLYLCPIRTPIVIFVSHSHPNRYICVPSAPQSLYLCPIRTPIVIFVFHSHPNRYICVPFAPQSLYLCPIRTPIVIFVSRPHPNRLPMNQICNARH
jgi:hypothetical protein